MPSSTPGFGISRGGATSLPPTPPTGHPQQFGDGADAPSPAASCTVNTGVEIPERLAPAEPALERARPWALVGTVVGLGRFAPRKPLGALGALIVIALLVMAMFAERIAPYGYDDTIRGARMKPPSTAHWLGTDNLSRDMWSRIVYGARVSITVGFATIGLAVFLASVIGVSSGYFGGAYDLVIQRLVDAWLSFPYLVIILSVMAVPRPRASQPRGRARHPHRRDQLARDPRRRDRGGPVDVRRGGPRARLRPRAHHRPSHPAQRHGDDHHPGDDRARSEEH